MTKVSGEAQTNQVFQLITGHRAGGILPTHGGHLWLTVGAWQDANNATSHQPSSAPVE